MFSRFCHGRLLLRSEFCIIDKIKTMLKRAVITGMGVVSPNGIGKTAFCRAILDGKSGVKNITRFDASDLPVKIAGEIQDFNELDWVEARSGSMCRVPCRWRLQRPVKPWKIRALTIPGSRLTSSVRSGWFSAPAGAPRFHRPAVPALFQRQDQAGKHLHHSQLHHGHHGQ